MTVALDSKEKNTKEKTSDKEQREDLFCFWCSAEKNRDEERSTQAWLLLAGRPTDRPTADRLAGGGQAHATGMVLVVRGLF